ncbi:UNVERIFIED_CONTAM: hypothetical protein ABIC26_001794 [Paenibacillus sp. PvR008]
MSEWVARQVYGFDIHTRLLSNIVCFFCNEMNEISKVQ